MSQRGEYRAIYVAFWDDPDVHALSDRAYRVLTTLKGTLPAGGIGVVYASTLAERCGCTAIELESALQELEAPKRNQRLGWIMRERNIVWLVNGLRYESAMVSRNAKHRRYVERLLQPLGENLEIVRAYRRYYAAEGWLSPPSAMPLEGVSGRSLEPIEGVSNHKDLDLDLNQNQDPDLSHTPRARATADAGEFELPQAAEPLAAKLGAEPRARRALTDFLAGLPHDQSATKWIAALDGGFLGGLQMPLQKPAKPEHLVIAIEQFSLASRSKYPYSAANLATFLQRVEREELRAQNVSAAPARRASHGAPPSAPISTPAMKRLSELAS